MNAESAFNYNAHGGDEENLVGHDFGYEIEDVIEERETPRRPRMYGRVIGALVAAGAIIGSTLIPSDTEPATPEFIKTAEPTCYGDYCSGKYADETNCDEDAHTIAEAVVLRAGVTAAIEVKNVSIGVGNTDPNEVGRLELRASDRCGTVWGRLNAKSGKSLDYNGINEVGAQQDGGYTQTRDIAGNWTGSPPAISFSPMIYGRGRSYRAFVEAGVNFINSKNGTYWVDGPK